MNKRVLILGGDNQFNAVVYNYLKKSFDVVGVVVESDKPLRERLVRMMKFIRWRWRRLGVTTALGQLLFSTFIDRPLRIISKKRQKEIIESHGLSSRPIDKDTLIYVRDHNSHETVEAIELIKPDIIVVNGTGILRANLLDSIHVPILNLHTGITPKYRGVHGMYWALVNDDEANSGVTVHFVDKGVDTGPIINQARVKAAKNDNFATYPYLQIAEGVKILEQSITRVLNGEYEIIDNGLESRQYFHPTLWQYLRNRLKHGVK